MLFMLITIPVKDYVTVNLLIKTTAYAVHLWSFPGIPIKQLLLNCASMIPQQSCYLITNKYPQIDVYQVHHEWLWKYEDVDTSKFGTIFLFFTMHTWLFCRLNPNKPWDKVQKKTVQKWKISTMGLGKSYILIFFFMNDNCFKSNA